MKHRVLRLGAAAVSVSALTLSGCLGTSAESSDSTSGQDSAQFQTYHYVLIEDLEDPSTASPTHTAGADIDAVELNDGVFASQLQAFSEGPGDNDFADAADDVLAAPEGGCPTSGTPNYFSMGGTGGYLIVSFAELAEIEEGDTITVYECGSTDEPFDVFVGVGTAVTDPNWVQVIANGTGEAHGIVPSLPQIPID